MLKPFKYSLFIVIGIALAVGVSKVFYPLVAKRNQLIGERAAVVADNEHLRKKVSEYKQKQNDFQTDPEYIELIARRKGLVKRSEVVFDFSHLVGE